MLAASVEPFTASVGLNWRGLGSHRLPARRATALALSGSRVSAAMLARPDDRFRPAAPGLAFGLPPSRYLGVELGVGDRGEPDHRSSPSPAIRTARRAAALASVAGHER